MNSTSFGELGGSFALVEEGSTRVGSPGAPGWTTTGISCCADTVVVAEKTIAHTLTNAVCFNLILIFAFDLIVLVR
jgi:hypothetical protein